MATGDVTLTIAVEGGVAKTVVVDSATRALAKTYADTRDGHVDLSADADWQEDASYGSSGFDSTASYPI